MIALHLQAIHAQLQQAYVGMALAVAAGRAFILPQVPAAVRVGGWVAGWLAAEGVTGMALADGCQPLPHPTSHCSSR